MLSRSSSEAWRSASAQGIVYRETIAAGGGWATLSLRHYAEVHLLLGPARGQRCSSSPPAERDIWTGTGSGSHPGRAPSGVLTGSPVRILLRITLVAGRAQAHRGGLPGHLSRAVRQGLMQAEHPSGAPGTEFRLETPRRGMWDGPLSDLQRMTGGGLPAETEGEETVLTGAAPVSLPAGLCPGGGRPRGQGQALLHPEGATHPVKPGGGGGRPGLRQPPGHGESGGARCSAPTGQEASP